MKLAFGQDPMDEYSVPVSKKSTKLSTIYKLKLRDRKDKPGRLLEVIWDARKPVYEGFGNRYSYVVFFKKQGSIAGNHYHKAKHELFFPLAGKFSIFLEDIKTKGKEEILMEASSREVIYIRPTVVHAVRAQTKDAVLLVMATSPGVEADEFSWNLI